MIDISKLVGTYVCQDDAYVIKADNNGGMRVTFNGDDAKVIRIAPYALDTVLVTYVITGDARMRQIILGTGLLQTRTGTFWLA